jgi:hypothetical protein
MTEKLKLSNRYVKIDTVITFLIEKLNKSRSGKGNFIRDMKYKKNQVGWFVIKNTIKRWMMPLVNLSVQ